MVLRQMVVDAVVFEGRSIREVARSFGVSKSWVYELVRRYREGGERALEERSKAHHTNPRQMSAATEEELLRLRKELLDLGADHGAATLQWHLAQREDTTPSVSAIYRMLKRRGFITPEPRKRPKGSYIRFEASLPNECWQSDMTHWHLDSGAEVEILTFLDDYSRLVLACEVFPTVKASNVRATFKNACAYWGIPASVLTDNGAIFNAGSRKGRTGFESDLLDLGVLYKHSRPYHPQTCGKVERWHATLKGFLEKHPCDTIEDLQLVLLKIVRYYNEERPHRARGSVTPRHAYAKRDKALAGTLINEPHLRIRYDTLDSRGKVTLRYLGDFRHIYVGYAHRGERVRLYVIDAHVRVVSEDGELLSELEIDPTKRYQKMSTPSSD
jgi:transposase InsO family protein